jgi:hypothetical protein
MLLESDVINAVCKKLESLGYFIQQKLQTEQHGDDIIAGKTGLHPRKLFIEAKGETSSRKGSERYGKPFDSAQVRVHVAEAFYKSAQVLSRETADDVEILSGIALPDTKLHHSCVKNIQPILTNLKIIIFWVHESNNVQITSPIQL